MTEISDAYEEYVRTRREDAKVDKLATLTLPASQMAAIWALIADAVAVAPESLPRDIQVKWESILRSIAKAIAEAL